MKKTVFSLDGNGAFVGLYDPQKHWNGWAIPYFTKEESIRVLTELSVNGHWKWGYNEEGDYFTLVEMENMDGSTWEAQEIDGQKMYSIGGQYLVWVAEDDKTFFRKDKSGRDGHYSLSLIDIVEDRENQEEYEEADDLDETLIGWAMNAEVGDEYVEDHAAYYTRIA